MISFTHAFSSLLFLFSMFLKILPSLSLSFCLKSVYLSVSFSPSFFFLLSILLSLSLSFSFFIYLSHSFLFIKSCLSLSFSFSLYLSLFPLFYLSNFNFFPLPLVGLDCSLLQHGRFLFEAISSSALHSCSQPLPSANAIYLFIVGPSGSLHIFTLLSLNCSRSVLFCPTATPKFFFSTHLLIRRPTIPSLPQK